MAGTLAAIVYHERHLETQTKDGNTERREPPTPPWTAAFGHFCFLICMVSSTKRSNRHTQVPCSGSRPMREGLRPKRMLKDLPTEGVVLG